MAMFRRVIGTFNRNLRLMWFLSLMTRGNPISNDGERRIRSASSDTTTARSWTYRQTARCQLTKEIGNPCVSRIRVSIFSSPEIGRGTGSSTRIFRLEAGRPVHWTMPPYRRPDLNWVMLALKERGLDHFAFGGANLAGMTGFQ